MTTTIAKDPPLLTLINVLRVEPENQDRVVSLLVSATDQVMSRLAGFVSANIHRSLDGRQVVNYAQWRSRAHFEAIFDNAEATQHMQALRPFLVSSDRNVYEVASIHEQLEEAAGVD